MECVELDTDRLILRTPSDSDVDQITALCQDATIAEFTRLPQPYEREDALTFVRHMVPDNWRTGAGLTWGIYSKATAGPLMGVISIMDRNADTGDIGYWLGSEFRGNGYMAEATGRVIAFAFAPAPHGLDMRRLGWEANRVNAPSARIAQNAGFRWEGVRRSVSHRQGVHYDLALAGLLNTDDPTTAQPWPAA